MEADRSDFPGFGAEEFSGIQSAESVQVISIVDTTDMQDVVKHYIGKVIICDGLHYRLVVTNDYLSGAR